MNNKSADYMQDTVLIVDDAPANLAVLSDTLSEAGYRVLVATDGVSALEQIGYMQPDIILLDVMMPGIDGFETCRRLKSKPLTATIPIIFMTGLSELDDLLRGFGEGALDYLIKPVRPPEVLARVNAQLFQLKTLQRAEDALSHVAFAALAFNSSGLLTWLTPAAISVLCESYPETIATEHDVNIADSLPLPILAQVKPWIDTSFADSGDKIIHIGRYFSGKIVPSHQTGEYMLLMQKRNRDWDLDSLKKVFGLTPREAEILMWISRGKTNKEVGLILSTSPRTVNKHLEHVFEKLGVPTRTAAVAKVLDGHKH